jgi:hypothetical protein
MKTTVEIPDTLLEEARRVAAQERTTLRALIEAGLRTILDQRGEDEGFRLRDASVSGRGLRPELTSGDWQGIRTAAYEGRGG